MIPLLDRLMTRLRQALLPDRTPHPATSDRMHAQTPDFQLLFDASPIGMAYTRDRQCEVICQNPALDRMLGPVDADRSQVQVLHQGHVLAAAQQPLQQAAATGEAVLAMELEIAIEGRLSRHVIANAVPLLDRQGQPGGAITTLVDITERKRVEAQAEHALTVLIDQALAARLDAENASRAEDELLTMLAHELRNPLGAIAAAADVLESPQVAPATASEARAVILRQTRILTHLIHDLLESRRVLAGKASLSPEAFDLAACQPQPALPRARRRNVLVIDEHGAGRTALRARLELEGHSVHTAPRGEEGLTRLLQLKPEIALVTIGGNGLPGPDLARRARAAGYAGRMIAISAEGDTSARAAALTAGFDGLLGEPIDAGELRASFGEH